MGYDPTTEKFKPFVLPEYFQLPAGGCEWEVSFYPSGLHGRGEECYDDGFKRALEVGDGQRDGVGVGAVLRLKGVAGFYPRRVGVCYFEAVAREGCKEFGLGFD